MIYTGENEYPIYLGDSEIPAIYCGEEQIYPMTVKEWSVKPTEISMPGSSGTTNIKIASTAPWTISASENWITFSQNSGDSGRTTVVATFAQNQSGSARTANITATDGTSSTTISVSQKKYVELPTNSFVINYNAKDYNPTTRTILRTSGQTLDQDMVFKKSTSSRYTNGPSAITQYDDHISFSAGTYSQFSFANGSSNPFNITSSNNNLTIVIKYYRNKDWTDPVYPSSPGTDVIMNRGTADNKINFFLRCSDNDDRKQLQFNGANSNYITWSNYPVIEAVRMSGLTTTIMNFTDNIIGDPFTFSLKPDAGNANRITFMGQNYTNTATDVVNCIGGDFYWVYISREVLTDEEIAQVIDYNENI